MKQPSTPHASTDGLTQPRFFFLATKNLDSLVSLTYPARYHYIFCTKESQKEHFDIQIMTRLPSLSLLSALAATASVSGFSSLPTGTATFTRQSSRNNYRFLSALKATDNSEKQESGSGGQAILDEANDALANVGWAPPREDGEMTSDDPFVQEINAGIQRDFGVDLDELLNPAKVVNLERDLYNLRLELADMTGITLETTTGLTTDACDGGGGGEAADAVRAKIDKKEKDLLIERRSVFRGWLKNVFLVQAVLSFGLSFVMATNPEALFGQFAWFNSYNM